MVKKPRNLTYTPYLFFVEDVMAWRYLNAVLRYYQQTEDKLKVVKIVHVGGYEQVVQLAQTFYTTPPFEQRAIQSFPDADVQQTWDALATNVNRTPSESRKLDLLNRNRNNITMLDITPELGVWDWLNVDASAFENSFASAFGQQVFNMQDLVNQVAAEEVGFAPGRPREHAKGCFKNLVEKLQAYVPAATDSLLQDILFRSYVDDKMADLNVFNSWKNIFKSIFNRV